MNFSRPSWSLGKWNSPQTLCFPDPTPSPCPSFTHYLEQAFKASPGSRSILQNLSPTATSAYQLPMLSCQPTLKGKILCSIFKYIEQRSSLICLCKGWLSPKFTVILFLSLIETWKSDAYWVQILSLYLSTMSFFGKSLHLPETRSPSM